MKFEKLTELIEERITGEWGQEPDSSGVKVIRTTNFTNEGKIDLSNVVERDIEEKKIERKALRKGDIIIEKSGGGPTQPVGRVVFFDVDSDEKYLCNNFSTVLRPNNSIVHSKYLLYQMLYLYKTGRTKKYQNKTTGIHNLNLEKYLQEKIALPQIPDQLHIADLLSKAENLIAQRKESIRLLDEYLKSTFLEMFGDPVRNEKGWEKVVLGNVCGKIGSGSTPRGGKESYHSEGISLIRSLNVHNDTFVYKDLAFIDDKQAHELRNVIIEENDVLLNITGASVARCCIVPKEILPARVNQHVSIIRPDANILNPRFLSRMFTCENYQLKLVKDAKSKGATREAITKEELELMKVIAPPKQLQTQFAQIVEKTETLKTQYQQSLQELENLYGSLSQKAFRGELSIKDESLLMAAEPLTPNSPPPFHPVERL